VPPLLKLVLPVGLCLLLLAVTLPTAGADEATQARSRLERLSDELGQALGRLRQGMFERDTLRTRLAEADRQVAQVNARLQNTERQSAALEQALAALREQQTAARAQIDQQRQILGRSLALAARGGAGDRLQLLLKQQDPALLARQLRYQRYVADAQAARLAALRGQLDAFVTRENQIAAQADRLAASRTELQQQRQELDRLRQERMTLLAQADQDVSRGEQRVHAIEQDQRDLTQLLASIAQREAQAREAEAQREAQAREAEAQREAQARADEAKRQPQARRKAQPGDRSAKATDQTPPEPTTGQTGTDDQPPPSAADAVVGSTPTPSAPGERFSAQRSHLPWPLSGQLKARFGTPRESGRTRWDGVIIGARPGSTVRSIHAGKVVYADVLGGYGLLVIVDHGEGYLSLYGYNDAVLKRPGQRVATGEPIASVGDRGSASGLYFEIRYRGQPVNPTVWCGG